MKGLLIKQLWMDMILVRRKTWEIRGSATSVRGRIALIESGTGTVVGFCDITDVVGPLTIADFRENMQRHHVTEAHWDYYSTPHAWIIRGARRLSRPVPYEHPRGAVIWVNLADSVARKVQ